MPGRGAWHHPATITLAIAITLAITVTVAITVAITVTNTCALAITPPYTPALGWQAPLACIAAERSKVAMLTNILMLRSPTRLTGVSPCHGTDNDD